MESITISIRAIGNGYIAQISLPKRKGKAQFTGEHFFPDVMSAHEWAGSILKELPK